jgi:hypothetical protein
VGSRLKPLRCDESALLSVQTGDNSARFLELGSQVQLFRQFEPAGSCVQTGDDNVLFDEFTELVENDRKFHPSIENKGVNIVMNPSEPRKRLKSEPKGG